MVDFLKIICLDETLRAKYSTHNVMRRMRERAFLVSTLSSSSLSLPFPESSFVSHTGPSTGPRMLLRTPGHSRRCCWVHFYPKKTNNLFFSECNWVWTIYEDPVDPKEMNLGFYSYWFPKGLIVHTSLGGSAREGTPWGKTISLPYLRWYLTSNVVKKLTG